jgi:hypothetical protein
MSATTATPWPPGDLTAIGRAEELQITSLRPDGTPRPYVTIWVVRAGDGLFVRSARGPGNGWFARAVRSGAGRIRAAGLERDVTFTEPRDEHAAIDAAYHAKYDRYGAAIVGSVAGAQAAAATLRLLPRFGKDQS